MWCRRRLLRVPCTARRSNQSFPKEISPEYPLEGLMLKLKLQYFGHLMRRTDLLEKTLMLGKIEGRRRRGYRGWDGWMASPTWWSWVWASSESWWWTGKPGIYQSLRLQRVGHNWATELTVLSAQSLQSCPTLCNLWTVAHQAPVSTWFSRQEYWRGLPCPPPGNLPNPGIELMEWSIILSFP